MAHSRIIDELIARDPKSVHADLEAIKREKAALEAEEALLSQVLAIQAMRNGQGKAREVADVVADGRVFEVKGRHREGPSTSAIVLDVMREHAHTWMTYDDVYGELQKKGVVATRNAMRVALGRWVERGKLEADDDGCYRFIVEHGAQTPLEGGNS
jgi:hypothetical protein